MILSLLFMLQIGMKSKLTVCLLSKINSKRSYAARYGIQMARIAQVGPHHEVKLNKIKLLVEFS